MKRSRSRPRRPTTKFAALVLLCSLIVRGNLSTVTPNAKIVAVAQAYATRPQAHGPCGKSSCVDARKQSRKLVRGLRCGGTRNFQGPAFIPKRAASALAAESSYAAEAKNSAESHLIWSPNFWKKLAISTILWLISRYAVTKNKAVLENLFSFDACHGGNAFQRFFQLLLPLLSSSCCAVQLLVNALSGWGCAGFNTILGPIRPILLPLFLYSTIKLQPQRPLGWTFASLFLGFLPEIVDVWNTNRSLRWKQKHAIDNDGSAESASTTSPLPITAKLRLDIPTMGCVACVNKINTSIRQCGSKANVREETSRLSQGDRKGGTAELLLSVRTHEDLDLTTKEVIAAVNKAGFDCTVESLQID